MGKNRTWQEREQIIRAIIASDGHLPLETFDLTESERIFFRARSARAVKNLARKTSAFRAYYNLPTANPFLKVVIGSGLIGSLAVSIALAIYKSAEEPKTVYPILAACISVSVIALGWSIGGWISHRNTIRQNTNSLLFARFAQQAFTDALFRFHKQFGHDILPRISWNDIEKLRESENDEDRKAAAAIVYLLNYYEFIAMGVTKGDLNKEIIRGTIRGNVIFYYDKCEPIIRKANSINALTFEHLIKLRTHYREP